MSSVGHGSPRPRAGRRRRSRGQALVELALVTPVLLLLLLGAVDLGRLFYARISVNNAAREGAMAAAQAPGSFSSGSPCGPSNVVMCAATREPRGSFVTVSPADVALSCSPSCAKTYGTTVRVTVTGHFQVLTPLIWVFTGGPDVSFDATADADVVVIPPAPLATAAPTPSPTPTPTPSPDPSASSNPSASPVPTASPAPTPSPTPACAPPVVGFNPTQQNKNSPVVFTSTSTPTSGSCAISYWRWEFGDGTTHAGDLPTASHDYGEEDEGKTFNVTLTVTTPGGTFSFVRAVKTAGK